MSSIWTFVHCPVVSVDQSALMFSPTLTTVALSGDVGVMTANEVAASASATRDLANMAIKVRVGGCRGVKKRCVLERGSVWMPRCNE